MRRLRRLRFCDYIPDPVERNNAVNSLIDGSLYSIMVGLTQPFWGAFAVHLGASDYMVGLLTSLPALATLLAQVPSALLVDRYDNRLEPTLKSSLVSRSFYLVFAFLAFAPLPLNVRAWVFIVSFALMNFPGTMCGIAWTAMMGEMFTPRLRARIFAERNMVATLVSLIATVVAGRLLDLLPWPSNYTVLYLLGYGFVMGSWYYLTRLKEKPLSHEGRRDAPAGLKAFYAAWKDKSFVKFIGSVFVIYIGFHLTAALWTILWVKMMGLSNTWIGMFSTASGIMSFLTYKQWGRWSEKYGNQKVLLATTAAHILFPLIYSHFRSPYVFVAINAFAGFFGAGFNLSIFNGLLDVSPDAARPTYVALYNIVLGLSGFIWPLVGVSMYRAIGMTLTLDLVFVIRILVTLAAGLLLADKIKERQDTDRE